MSDEKNDLDENQENMNDGDLGGDDENFGLPDLDYKPLDREAEEKKEEEEKPKPAKKPRKAAAKPKATKKKEEEKKEEPKEEEKVEEPKQTEKVEEKEETVIPPVTTATDEPDFKFDDDSSELDDQETTPEDFNLEYAEVEERKEEKKKEEDKKSMGPIIISLVILVLVIGAVLAYIFWYQPAQTEKNYTAAIEEGQKAYASGRYDEALAAYGRAKELKPAEAFVDEQISLAQNSKNQAIQKKKNDEAAAALAAEEAKKAAEAEAAAAKGPAAGTVERISAVSGKYYIVVASSIDGDLATDHANRIAKNGAAVQILSPRAKVKYHRVTIAYRDSFQEAQDHANSVKGEYSGAWVVKY